MVNNDWIYAIEAIKNLQKETICPICGIRNWPVFSIEVAYKNKEWSETIKSSLSKDRDVKFPFLINRIKDIYKLNISESKFISCLYYKTLDIRTDKNYEFLIDYEKKNPEIKSLAIDDEIVNSLNIEIMALLMAMKHWLTPSKEDRKEKGCWETPLNSYLSCNKSFNINNQSISLFNNTDIFINAASKIDNYYEKFLSLIYLIAIKTQKERNMQYHTLFTGVSNKQRKNGYIGDIGIDEMQKLIIERVYAERFATTYGLLPLAWAELMYCVKNNLNLIQCEKCNNYFVMKKGKYNSKYCLQCTNSNKISNTVAQRKRWVDKATSLLKEGQNVEEIYKHFQKSQEYPESAKKYMTKKRIERLKMEGGK